MSMVDVGPFAPYIPLTTALSNSILTIDAASEVAGAVFRVKAGNIRYIHWRTLTVTTGGANNVDVRLETVDAANGRPTGTLWAANTNASVDVADANDNTWFRTQLTADATVAVGDVVAALVVNPAASFGNMGIALGFSMFAQSAAISRMPYSVGPLRSNLISNPPAMLLEYSDGTFNHVFGYTPFFSSSVTINTGTNPDEVCLIFTPDAPFRIMGYGCTASIAAGGDWRMALYEDGNNTPLLTSATQDGNIVASASIGTLNGLFSTEYVVSVGTKYRLSLLPLTATSIVLLLFTTPGSAANTAMNFAQFQYGTRNRSGTSDPDSAAWTDTNDIPCIWPIADQMDNGAALQVRRDYQYGVQRRRRGSYAR